MRHSISRRFFRLLLRLYPRGFRESYGADMERMFLVSLQAHSARRGRLGAVYACLRVTWDTLANAVAVRTGSEEASRRATVDPGAEVSRPEGSLRTTLGSILRDGRFASRGLRKSPTFTVVVVLTAAFGITLSTLVFTALNASVFRPLPHVRNPEELVKVVREFPTRPGRWYNFSYADYEHLREQATTVEDVVAAGVGDLTQIDGIGEATANKLIDAAIASQAAGE